jgi:hypothetical protein
MKQFFAGILLCGCLTVAASAQIVDHVEARVSPNTVNGPCPATFHFQGVIVSTGKPGTVYYHWVKNDNSKTVDQSTSFRNVRERRLINWQWTMNKPSNVSFHGGARLEVVRPQRAESPMAEFTLHCKPRR